MKKYETKDIRNLALVGHSDCGKTTIAEALLYYTKAITRMGKIEEGNTVSDFDPEEISRKISIGLSVLPFEWEGKKVNLIDTPGYFDFEGQVLAALRAAESALMVIDASAGIEVGTEKYWKYTEKIDLPRVIFLNKMDKPNVDFNVNVSDLHQNFGKKVVPLTLTLGMGESFEGLIDIMDKKAYKYDGFQRTEVEIPEIRVAEVEEVYNQVVELIAMTDDSLMEKYFEGESFTDKEIRQGMTTAILEGSCVPLIAGCATTGAGIDLLLESIIKYMPSPADERAHTGFRPVEGEVPTMSVDSPMSCAIFKTIVDPFIGKISIFKAVTGKVEKNTEIYNSTKGQEDKAAGLFYLQGKKQIPTDEVVAGDIGAFSKLEITETGDTISDKNHLQVYKKAKLPASSLTFAITATAKSDEDKLGPSLQKLHEEDATFLISRNQETKQLLISGLGNVQLEAYMNKLKNNYGVSTEIVPLVVPYRETIKGRSDVQGRHKKQSGGAGQFGDVFIRFEPIEEGFEFAEEVFGGAVPKNYFPAVQKGLEESMEEGLLAGFPVTGVKATLYDGSYHPVDSNEMAFKIAASLAFKKGIKEANPILLEPIYSVHIVIPDAYLGDVMGDMNKRRGRILGMEQDEEGNQIVNSEAPYAELTQYAIDLRSMTQGRGDFSMEFSHYEEVPRDISEKIIEKAQKEEN